MERIMCASAVVLVAALALPSQATAENLIGARVRIETAGSPGALVGTVVEENAAGLYVERESKPGAFLIPREDVFKVEVSSGYRRRTAEGILGGVLAWAMVVGAFGAGGSLDESGVGEPFFILAFPVVGGIVGSQLKAESWKRVPLSRVSVRPLRRQRGVGIIVAVAF